MTSLPFGVVDLTRLGGGNVLGDARDPSAGDRDVAHGRQLLRGIDHAAALNQQIVDAALKPVAPRSPPGPPPRGAPERAEARMARCRPPARPQPRRVDRETFVEMFVTWVRFLPYFSARTEAGSVYARPCQNLIFTRSGFGGLALG